MADRIGAVVVVALTRTRRGLVSELELTAVENRVPSDCVVNFDNIHTLPRTAFRIPTPHHPAVPGPPARSLSNTPGEHGVLSGGWLHVATRTD